MRALYSLLFYLFLPFIFLRLIWRGIQAPNYWLRWNERLGYYAQNPTKEVVWIHAVSVGETEAVFPLLKQLQLRYPQQSFLVTTTTPTGSSRVVSVLGDSVIHVYLPYDTPGAVKRFFNQFRPKLAVIMETEIWPNLFNECHLRDIPLFIINARLSESSVKRYCKLTTLVRSTLQNTQLIATQSALDAQRFISIGAPVDKVRVIGNIKFDQPAMEELIAEGQQLKANLFAKRFVWIIASTHKNEEQIFIALFPKLKHLVPELLMLFVPRHPERFREVKNLCVSAGFTVTMRTDPSQQTVTTDMYIADTLGELKMLYAAADLAFVGGSLVPVGGHNVLEAAATRTPVMFGPFMANFTAIADGLLLAGGAVQCQDQDAIVATFQRLYQDEDYKQQLIDNATNFVQQNRGATKALMELLQNTNTL